MPSLNDRPEDILPLVKHFLLEFSAKFGKKFSGLAPEAEAALLRHTWTGNVRELRNLVERGVLVGKGRELTARDLDITADPIPGSSPAGFPPLTPEGIDIESVKNALEEHYLEEAFKMAEGNESRAARLLNLNHHTYRYRRKMLQKS